MLPDLDARRRALTDFGRNLVVTAGAGTGKTSLLVGRVLGALLCQHMDPARVLAVTFTENAAAEMRARLGRLLRAVPAYLDGGTVEGSDRFVLDVLGVGPEHRRRADELLGDLDRIALATFHGFCLRLLQENAPDLDLPATLRVGTDESVRGRFDRDYLAFLAEAADGPAAAVLHTLEAHELRELAFALLTLPEEAWDALATPFAPGDLDARRADLETLLARFPRARQAWRDLGDQLLRHYALAAGAAGAPDRALLEKSTPKAGKRELGETDDRAATDAMNAHREFLAALLLTSEDTVAAARTFLLPFLRSQRRSRAQAGELSFDDLLLLTRRVLMDRGAVRRRLAQRYQTILVDEFQDTDPLQYDVLFLLGADPSRDAGAALDDPAALPLRPCLFIVGDAKQSVYRFRRADVGAYFRAVERIAVAGDVGRLVLTANFRSRPQVLDFVNAVCAHTLTEDIPYQLGYEPVHAVRAPAEVPTPVELLLLPRGDGRMYAAERRAREGRAIVRELARLLAAGARPGGIAVLLRAAADTAWLLRPLRQAGIPYVMQGSRRFYSRHEIVLAGALLAALARPSDPVPILAVLRSPLCGATDAELLAHRAEGGQFDYRAPTGSDGSVADGLRLLAELAERVATLPLHEALPTILRLPALLLAEGAGFEGAQRLANLERLLLGLLAAAPLDLAAAAALVEQRALAETDDEESPLFEDGGDAVRVMTVHAAKGLEFDTVLLPDLARRLPSDADGDRWSAQRIFTADGRELVAVQVGEHGNRAANVAKAEGRRHLEAEERRLFYVAATRARERLLLLGHDDDVLVQQSLWQADLVQAPLATIPGFALRLLDEPALAPESPDQAAGFDVIPALAALARHRDIELRAAQSARTAPRTPSATDAAETSAAATMARAAGRAAHAYLALVSFSRAAVDAELLARVAPDTALRRRIEPWLSAFHGSPLRTELASARQLDREVAVSFRDSDGGLVHGVIDVLFATADGEWHVLDWKTDREADPDRHRAQLDAYARGVQAALGLDARPRARPIFLRARERDDA